ncbi:hypothetical protein I316_01336 [Kwoniella heveanensis BCC8398]|uniref:ubiquitinyl hydrolase 1 n=1 Tax=Kwoniella heveanensis BCC8398 TaxID=1296120 RepID=A0A1B9H0F7_9TREE|nr:hypothetical protein I316_01336 [Kwoniella heveanensis BCC8398]
MTADKSSSSQGQASSTSPSGSKSPRSPSRSQTVNSQYARAYQYHSFRDADKDAVPSTPTRTSGSGSGSAAGAGAGAGSPRTSSTSPQSPRRSLGHTSTHSHEHTHVRPAGPRSPDSKHHGPGSSRTRYHTTPLPATSNASQSATSSSPSQTRSSTLNIPTSPTSMRSDHTATHSSPKSTITAELDSAQPHAPYRPPEPVIEPPEEHPPGYTPGIVAEHIEGDDELASSLANDPPLYQGELRGYVGDVKGSKDIDIWQEDVKTAAMDIDPSDSDDIPRPQIGAGVLPRRLLMLVHEHELVQPQITQLPPVGKSSQAASSSTAGSASRWDGSNKALTSNRPLSVASSSSATNLAAPPSPSPSSASARSLPDVEHISSLDDVWEALPGGLRDHGEWYFCTTCWGWIRITGGTERLPTHLPWNERDKIYRSTREREKNEIDPEELEKLHTDWKREVAILEDLQVSREMSEETHHHFHEFESLPVSQPASRIPRVEVDERMNVFPHITFQLEADARWTSFGKPLTPTRRFISCSSDLWLQVDEGVIAGQLPVGLVRAFTDEKINNPSAGLSGVQSVNDAWNLIATLLSNPLFKGQRGWVKLDNPKFQKTIGASVISSNLLYQIGFACQQEADGLRVGPFKVGEEPSEEDRMKQKQMDQYMIRTWIEISMYLSALQKRNDLPPSSASFVQTRTLDECIKDVIELDFYPQPTQPYNDLVKRALYQLGATKQDRAQTIEIAYGLQIACDAQNTPLYLSALEKIAEAPTFGRESLQMRVATERSLNKYTIGELADIVVVAYDAIGYTSSHAEEICVMPHEAPEDYILNMHKKAVQAATSPNERWELSRALLLIGRERKSELMQRLGDSGQTLMSVEEAYAALSCPMDAVDDGLLMQYEMAVSEYPGKADHYRNCLSIIANAPGQERPGIKTFLETGSREPEAPARNDIPVGLHNIGRYSYLNSILQYLYSIKPLRDAVISFEQNLSAPAMPSKPDVDRSKRFVRQLRLLFLQLYKSELPSVRPDEELAYLAITRPEVDAIVEPELHASPEATATAKPSKLTLDSIPDIPDIPSPSSTQVATPASTPGAKNVNLPSTSPLDPRGGSDVSVLGKRASEDRDDSSRSSLELEHVRHKSEGGDIVEGFERVARTQSPMEVDTDDFELIPKPDQAPSPSATMDLGHLDIKSPPPESDATAAGGSYAEDDYFASKGRQDTLKPPIPQQEEKFDPPSVPPPLPPRPNFAKKDTLSSGLRFGLQQDSAEVLINVLSQLELALDEPSSNDGEKGSNLIQRLFSCKYRQQIIYESPSSPSTSPSKSTPRYEAQTPVESVFVHPIIGVEEEGKDLSDCLAELYLKGADIEYEGKKGFMMDLMDEFPDMLYIQMRRSQFDPTTGRERKTNTHIPFNQTLSMGRFLVGADAKKREESIELTREMTRVRTRLHQLRNHKPLSIPQTFKHASAALRQLAASSDSDLHEVSADLNEDLFQALDAESTAVENEIAQLQDSLPRLKERMEAIWSADDDTSGSVGGGEEWDYELVSVFMHRGKNSGSGHYWTYQAHLPDHPETFFKYNDETVTAVPSSEVLQDRTGDDANPALLCYVRKGKNLIDTLHREILDRSVDQSQEQGGGEGARALIDI